MLKKYKYPLLFVAAILLSYLTNTFLYQRDSTGPHLATLFLVLCTIILLNCKHWLPAVAGFIITLIFHWKSVISPNSTNEFLPVFSIQHWKQIILKQH